MRLFAVLLFAVGCSAEPTPSVRQEPVVDLALSEQPLYSIGMADGPEEQQLYRVASASIRDDGGIVIANSGTRSIRAFDATGNVIWSSGRDGEGPGEYRLIRSASRIDGDTIVAWDPPQRRLTYLGPEGDVAAVVHVESAVAIQLSGDSVPAFPTAVTMLGDGTPIAEPGFPTQVMTRGPNGVRRDTIPLFVFDRTGALTATIGPIAGAETYVHDGSSMLMPFGHRLLIAAAGNSLYVGTGKGAIQSYNSDGTPTRSIDLHLDAVPISDSDFEQMKERWLARMVPQSRASMVEMLSDLPRLSHHPTYSRLLGGSDGTLLVQLYPSYADSVHRWLFVASDGEVRARLEIPAEYQLMDARQDRVAILRRDELDTEQIAVFGLHPSS